MATTFIIQITKNNVNYSNMQSYASSGTTLFGITAGSMSLNKILCDGEFELGSCNSAKFEVQIFNISVDITDATIKVYKQIDSNTPKQIFDGTIDSANKDRTNEYRDIVAYDIMYYKRDIEIADAWNGTDIWPGTASITLKTLTENLCTFVGIPYTYPTSLINDSLTFAPHFTVLSSTKFGTILKMICELQACFPVVINGVLNFVTIPSTASATAIDSLYDTSNSEFEDYNTATIDCINVYSTSSDLTQSVYTSTHTNAYAIAGNIFLLSMSAADVTTALTRVLNNISFITYNPAKIEFIVSDLTYELGKKLTTTRNGTTYTHYIFEEYFSDSLLVIQNIECNASGILRDTNVSTENNQLVTDNKIAQSTGATVTNEQKVYYMQLKSATAPSAPVGWVTSTSTISGVWTTVIPIPLYGCYYYSCTQTKSSNGSVVTSNVVAESGRNVTLDWCKNTNLTKIDGGNIFAHSVTASELDASSIRSDIINATYINSLSITAKTITIVDSSSEVLFKADTDTKDIQIAGFTVTTRDETVSTGPEYFFSTGPTYLGDTGIAGAYIGSDGLLFTEGVIAGSDYNYVEILRDSGRIVSCGLSPARTATGSEGTYTGYNIGGTSSVWNTVYCKQTSTGSARCIKKDIIDIPEEYDTLFDNLMPRRFMYKGVNADRQHIGFIVDEVGTAITAAGLTSLDYGAYQLYNINEPNGMGGLNYVEFIALNTWQIQKLKDRIAVLEEKLNG